MYFRFENLEVWKLSRAFTAEIYSLSRDFPKEEIFGLISQIRRAAVSITLNIAEGADRKSDKEFVRFLRMAITSLEEVVTALYIALDQKFINQEQFNHMYQSANVLASKINALIKAVSRKQ